MLLGDLTQTWEQVRATSSRRGKVGLLADCLRRLPPAEVAAGAAFLSGEHPLGRIGVGWATLEEALPPPRAGPGTLTVSQVDAVLRRVAAASGPGSRGERIRLLSVLLEGATRSEQDFLRSLIMRDLRQGALEGVVVEAVAAAWSLDPEEVRRALMVAGDLGVVAAAARAGGSAALGRFTLTLFRPLQPMLAQTASSLAAALEQSGPAAVEAKIDGARIQVHLAEGRVAVYTRSLREITDRVPDIVVAVREAPVNSAVFDGEAVALGADGRPLPFPRTMGRLGSRPGDETPGGGRPLSPFFFDCLHLDGVDLLGSPARARWEALAGRIDPMRLVTRCLPGSESEAAAFYGEVLASGHEGVVVKSLDAPYEAGRRGSSWLKVKPAHTLDLVVLAAEWGSGRRRGWLSNLHLGARRPATGGFVMLGKTFKGLTDEMLAWQTERLLGLEVARRGHLVEVRPELVVEVAFDGVQDSPRYPGGVTLRFARVRAHRPDKPPEEADTIDTVRALRRP